MLSVGFRKTSQAQSVNISDSRAAPEQRFQCTPASRLIIEGLGFEVATPADARVV
jgi:hypothetical protein